MISLNTLITMGKLAFFGKELQVKIGTIEEIVMEHVWPWWLHLFEAQDERDLELDLDDEEVLKKERLLLCGNCSAPITWDSARIVKNGNHEHSFFNPHGIIYQIGCFNDAQGCLPMGPASDSFSWFSGYSWRIVCCQYCQLHLGWDFVRNQRTVFYGFILDRLVLGE